MAFESFRLPTVYQREWRERRRCGRAHAETREHKFDPIALSRDLTLLLLGVYL
jgi:hypothetical protein